MAGGQTGGQAGSAASAAGTRRGAASPPTARALDVVELVAERAGEPVRLVDVARELALSKGTAHAILSTLCDRGWVVQDPVNRAYVAGPAIRRTAERAARHGSHEVAARVAADRLAAALGFGASVTRCEGDLLRVVATAGWLDRQTRVASGDRLPFAAPFGSTFAAWLPAGDQDAWIARTADLGSSAASDLRRFLASTRARGYTVERMAPPLVRAAEVMIGLHREPVSPSMRAAIADLLAEITAAGLVRGTRTAAGARSGSGEPVSSIAAPMFDPAGGVVLGVALHPFRRLTARQIASAGRSLTEAVAAASEDAA